MRHNKNKFSFRHLWGLFMALFYFILFYLVIFTPYLLPYNYGDNLRENDQFKIARIFLGLAMFAYGLFRAYKLIKDLRR